MRFEALATIFSRSNAPPPPLISRSRGFDFHFAGVHAPVAPL